MSDRPDAAPGARQEPPTGGRRGAPEVLVIDDDSDLCAIVSARLESAGHDVRCAFSAHEGYAAIRWRRPDVIVVDVKMESDSAGLDLVQRLRDEPATRDLAIVLVSGAPLPPGHGADRFLLKPVAFPLLAQAIAEIMEERANRD